MHTIKAPIFIFSLPRSGSTLLQRMLMSHSDIASLAEPWILLPLFYAQKTSGNYTEYNQAWSKEAVSDFIEAFPKGSTDYQEALRAFVLGLYSKHCLNEESYFLDKTPRYYLIIKEIAETFPDAKFIFLFRNPLEVLASILSTWSNNSLMKAHVYETDLKIGPKLLAQGYANLKHRAHQLDYKNLLANPHQELVNLCEYLNIPFEEKMISGFAKMRPKGRMGDTIGTNKYENLSTETHQKWTRYIDSVVFKRFFTQYIDSLDRSILLELGYEKETLLSEINRISVKKIGSLKNWYFWVRGRLILRFKLNLLFSQLGKKDSPKYLS